MKKLLLASCLLFAGLVPAVAGETRYCYSREYDRAHLAKHPDQTVTAMRISFFEKKDLPHADPHYNYILNVWFRGEDLLWTSQGNCTPFGPGFTCVKTGDDDNHFYVTRKNLKVMYLYPDHILLHDVQTHTNRTLIKGKDDDMLRLDDVPCWKGAYLGLDDEPVRFCVSVIEPPPNVVQDPEFDPKGWLGLREKPDIRSRIIFRLGDKEDLEADTIKGEWTHISNVSRLGSADNDYPPKIVQGWVHSKYVKKVPCEGEAKSEQGTQPEDKPQSSIPGLSPTIPIISVPSGKISVTPEEYRPINLPSAMIGSWCYNEGTEARQVYIRNDNVCVGTEGVLTVWPDSYGGSGGTCTFNKIKKLAMSVYQVRSDCKGLPKDQYSGRTWTEDAELQVIINNQQLIVTDVSDDAPDYRKRNILTEGIRERPE